MTVTVYYDSPRSYHQMPTYVKRYRDDQIDFKTDVLLNNGPSNRSSRFPPIYIQEISSLDKSKTGWKFCWTKDKSTQEEIEQCFYAIYYEDGVQVFSHFYTQEIASQAIETRNQNSALMQFRMNEARQELLDKAIFIMRQSTRTRYQSNEYKANVNQLICVASKID